MEIFNTFSSEFNHLCKFPDGLPEVLDWLEDDICISKTCRLLPYVIQTLPVILMAELKYLSGCTSVLLSAKDTWLLKPLVTPTVQQVFVFNDAGPTSVKLSNLRGRRTVIASCNSSDFLVKTEFESHTRLVSADQLNVSLPGDEISKDRTILLGTFNCTIFSATGPIHYGKPEWIDGVELNGVTSLLENRGFNWSIIPATSYGSLEDGKLISLVSKGKVDIGLCNYWINNGGAVANVLNPWTRSCTRLLVPRPQQVYTAWQTVKPLPPIFWALVIFSSFLSACSIRTLSSLAGLMPSRVKNTAKITFSDSCFEAVSLLLRGMGDHIRTNRELRVIQASWALFSVIFGAAYSSSLASILTTPLEEEAPQTLVELIEKGYVWVSGIDALSNPRWAFNTQSGVDEKWLKFQVSDASILKGKTTVLGEEIQGQFFLGKVEAFSEEFLHSLVVSKECLAANHISIMTRKGSSYYEFMSEGFSRLAETGILIKMMADGLKSPKINKFIVTATPDKKEVHRGVPLCLEQLRGAFYILIFGNILGLIAFIWEFNHLSTRIFIKKKLFKTHEDLKFFISKDKRCQ